MPILELERSCHPEDLLNDLCDLNGRRWWAVYTKARQEKSLARQLCALDLSFYLPLIPKDNLIRGRRVRSHIPLFPGYVFLFGSDAERVKTLTTNRVSRIIDVPNQLQLQSELASVHRLIQWDAPLAVERRLSPGTHVRVKTGPLVGMEGFVIRRHGKRRILVAVHYLHQGVSVEIDDCALEPL